MTMYPLISTYDLAVTNLSRFVFAPQLMGGKPVLTRQNQLLGYSGGYAVIYPINVSGMKLALRCWIKDPGDIKERYIRVKTYLQSNPTSYIVDFDYIDNGITAGGNTYPITCMEWVEGKILSQFIDENIEKPSIITTLASRFLDMVKELHSKNISHGDLQDGNIIVVQNSSTITLKLVDYDCIYVPTLQNWNNQDDLQGVPDYQHPKRYKKSNEKADYFSELVIFLSLLAYAEKPSLWKKGQEKRLLFTENDFRNPSASNTFSMLESMSPKIRNLSYKLREFCLENDTNRLLMLEQVIPSDFVLDGGKQNETASQLPSTAAQNSRILSVFLCHSSNDKPQVRELYKQLRSDQFDPWLDEEKLLPGQDWRQEISKAVRKADVIIVCLSCGSINKAGYVQKEIRNALDVADEQPDGTIFLIPLKLEECEVPERLSRWHWVNYFDKNGYKKLLESLHVRAESR